MKSRARALLVACSSALLLVAAFVPVASAGPPSGRLEPGVIMVMPAGWVCPPAVGEVTLSYLSGNWSFVAKSDGRAVQGMGTGMFEVSSSATGKSVVRKVTGVGVTSPDGSVLHIGGKAMWAFFPGEVAPGDQSVGRVLYFEGSQMVNYLTGEFTYSGRLLENLCDRLI